MQGDSFIANSTMPMLAFNLHVFCVTKVCDMDLPQHVRKAADEMFDEVQPCFYPPTDCSMIAAVCDPREKKPPWCDSFEKKHHHGLAVDAMVAAVFSRNGSKTKETPAAGTPSSPLPRPFARISAGSSPSYRLHSSSRSFWPCQPWLPKTTPRARPGIARDNSGRVQEAVGYELEGYVADVVAAHLKKCEVLYPRKQGMRLDPL